MKQIEDGSSIAAFDVGRAVRKGARVDGCAKVTSVSLRRLEIGNLRYVKWTTSQTASVSSKYCPFHERCMGHLRSADGTALLLPPCLSDPSSPYELSEVDKLTLQLARNNTSMSQYAVSLRNCISGKRGWLKYGCMGFTSLGTARGVATCVWTDPYFEVWLPSRWAERMMVPMRLEEGEYTSPYYSWRKVREGDYAILSRCPVLSHESVRCVRLRFWNEPAIGVHPEYCAPLNLDFDGDEVHVSIVTGKCCKDEAEANIRLNRLSKFSREKVASALDASGFDRSSLDTRCTDFMTLSTLSAVQDVDVVQMTPIHDLSRCKRAQWIGLSSHLRSRRARMQTFVQRSTDSVHDLTESHIRVSEGFTVGRQLKHVLFQTATSQQGTVTQWVAQPDRRHLRVQGPWCSVRQYGFPGTKLSSHVSGAIQQALMDKAKHGRGSETSGLLLSLLTGKCSFFISRDASGRLDVESGDRTCGVAVAALNRSDIAQLSSPADRFSRCLLAVKLGCHLSHIETSETEVAELAHALFCATYVDSDAAIADSLNVNFLSKTYSPALLAAACDDIYSLDGRLSHPAYSAYLDECRIACPVASIMSGNYADHLHRSQAEF